MDICECNNAMVSKEMLFRQISEYMFYISDLALYLNTHPCDETALRMHNEFAINARKLSDEYQKRYGPLTMDYPSGSWKWVESPWPWEGGY